MSKNFISEQQIKEALNIDTFRNLSKDKIKEFVSLIPNMDNDVALSIINQFPSYSEMAQCMVHELSNTCDTALSKNAESQNAVLAAYRKVLDDFGEVFKRNNISPEERESISLKMIDIANKIAAKDTENKGFLSWIVKNKDYVIGGVIILGGIILGINEKKE